MNWLIILGVCMMIFSKESESKEINWKKICKKIDSMSEKKKEEYQKILDEESKDGYEIRLEELCMKN